MGSNNLSAGLSSLKEVFDLVDRSLATVVEGGERFVGRIPKGWPPLSRGENSERERGIIKSQPYFGESDVVIRRMPHFIPEDFQQGIAGRRLEGMPFYGQVPRGVPSGPGATTAPAAPHGATGDIATMFTNLARQLLEGDAADSQGTMRSRRGHFSLSGAGSERGEPNERDASPSQGSSVPSGLGGSATTSPDAFPQQPEERSDQQPRDWQPEGESNPPFRIDMPPLPTWVTSLPSSSPTRRRDRFTNPRKSREPDSQGSSTENAEATKKMPDRLADMHALLLRMSDSLRRIEKGGIPARFG